MIEANEWSKYICDVKRDYNEAKRYYPYMEMSIFPTSKPSQIVVRAVAAEQDIITETCAQMEDFIGSYSKELYIEIPFTYRKDGCKIYGAKWLDKKLFQNKDLHFYEYEYDRNKGYRMCVGTPESFHLMKNVLLENIKTADAMLVAYERVQRGDSDKLNLIAYAHGNSGREQFQTNRSRYIPR